MNPNLGSHRAVLAVGLLCLVPPSCGDGRAPDRAAPVPGNGKPVVLTTFYPTLWFTQRIAGDAVDASCPVPEGEDPIFWEPAPDVIGRYQKADIVVINGAAFEKWVEHATLPESRIVDTAKSFEADFLRHENAITHSHGPEGEHSHEGIDGHTWLDPVQAIAQARAIRDALTALRPSLAARVADGFRSLERDLAALDAAWRALGAGPPLLASHPAYAYLARRYGWNVRSLDLDPEAVVGEGELAEIRAALDGHAARWLLWESAPTPEVARSIEEALGIRSIVIAPCELLGADAAAAGEDYLSIQRRNVETLRAVFADRPTE